MENNRALLFKKLSTVMGKMERMRKDGTNEYFKYKFVRDSDVSDTVRALLADENIAFIVSMTGVEEIVWSATDNYGKEKEKRKMRCSFEFTFVCGDTGESITTTWFSEALDGEDKGINKAATAAVKYFLLKTFLISTGDQKEDDPDHYNPEPEQKNKKPPTPTTQYHDKPEKPAQAKGTKRKALSNIEEIVKGLKHYATTSTESDDPINSDQLAELKKVGSDFEFNEGMLVHLAKSAFNTPRLSELTNKQWCSFGKYFERVPIDDFGAERGMIKADMVFDAI